MLYDGYFTRFVWWLELLERSWLIITLQGGRDLYYPKTNASIKEYLDQIVCLFYSLIILVLNDN